MKTLKILGILTLISSLSLFTIGCDDGKFSAVEYNNEIVDVLNSTSEVIEETTIIYDTSVPNIVTEDSEIDAVALRTSLNSAQAQLTSTKSTLDFQSRDLDQETAVKAEFTKYLKLGETYLSTYNEMITYYEDDEFKENLDLVAEYDNQLHDQYNAFIESNNELVDILDTFVD